MKPNLIFLILLLYLSGCKKKINPELYGVYYINDSLNMHYSEIKLYKNKKYYYYSLTCMMFGSDTGHFEMKDNTIYFTSYNLAAYCLHPLDTVPISTPNANPLTGKTVYYSEGKLTQYYYKIRKNKIHSGTIVYEKK
ncbi:MAG: hypothetical protein ACOZCO_08445 [Bacteroidota bacterium]